MRDHYLNTGKFMWPYSDTGYQRKRQTTRQNNEISFKAEREMGNLLKDLQITEFGRGIELGKNGILAWKKHDFHVQ